MARALREIEPDICYHVMNRGNNRQVIFHKDGDYEAFLTVLTLALARFDVQLMCWCLMPNHWHLVVRPRRRNFAKFMQWLTMTHVRRHHEHYKDQIGHLYGGRYKSFPVEDDQYFLILGRYVEANPLRAKLVARSEDWQWSSLRQRTKRHKTPVLTEWPIDRPNSWIDTVNEAIPDEQLKVIHESIERGRPLGSTDWNSHVAKRLGLAQTLRKRGRPQKPVAKLSPRQKLRRRSDGHKGV